MEKRLKALAKASAGIFAASSLEDTLRLITAAAREIVGAHQAVTSLTTDGSWAQAIVSVSLSDEYAAWRDFDAKPSGKGIYALVCAQNRPMRLTQAELEAHPSYRRFSDAAGRHPPLRGWLAAPLVARDGANLGLVQLSDKNHGDFDADDEALLLQLAQLAGLAIENLRLVEAARSAERRFEEFATLGNEVLWETDPEHRYTLFLAKNSFRMNSAPSAYLGKTRWEAALADPQSPLWVQHIAELEARRPIRNFEYPVPRRDGSMHYLRVNADPKFDAAGKFLGYRGATLNVTDLRRAEATAKANEQRFHEFAKLSSDVLWETDAAHRYTLFLVKGSFRMLREPEWFIGKTHWEATRVDIREPFWAAHRADLDAHRPLRNFEFSVTIDGKPLHLRVDAAPKFDDAGRFTGYRGTTQDVTELRAAEAAAKASEERFRQFAGIASDWLWETDAQHRFTYFAGAAGTIAERPYGKTRLELAGADLNHPHWRAHLDDIGAGRPFRNFEYTRIDATGRTRYITVSGQPFHGADGALAGYRGTATDITAQREAEAEARKAAEQYRNIVETANEGVWILDAEARTVFVNRRMAEMMGYAPEEMLGRPVYDFRPPEDRAARERRWAARQDGAGEQREARFTRRDGTVFWAQIGAASMKDANGNFAGALGMVSDITARKEAEAAVRASEDRFRDFAEVGSDWLWETDAEHRVMLLRGPAPISRDFALGRRRWEGADIDPDAPAWRRHRETLEQRLPFRKFEYEAPGHDGTMRYFSLSGKPVFDAAGAFVGYRGTTTDITAVREAERKAHASEDRFRDFAEVGTDWMWETDAEHRITMLDGPPTRAADFAFGKRRWEYGGVDPDAPEWRQHRGDLALHLPFRNFEYQLRDSEGAVRYFSLSGKPLFDAAGTFTGYRGTTRDITAQRRAEAKVRASEQRFKDFAGVASDWMWETDAEHRFSYFSPSREHSQQDASVAALGQTRWGYAGADLSGQKWQAHLADLEARRSFRGFEYQYRRPDGSIGTSLINGVPVFQETGEFAGYRGTATDITLQRAAEAAAHENERKYRHIVETANEGIWMLDAERRTTYVNPRMAEMLGYAPQEMLGRPHWDFMASADRPAAIADTRARQSHAVERQELRYLRKDGSSVWVLVTSNIVDDPASGAPGVLGMVTDITDRKTAEEALRAAEAAAQESERKYRNIVETANEGIWTLDAERRTTYVNPRMAEMLGYAPAEILGRHHWDFMSAEDRARAMKATQARPPNVIEREEVRYLRKDGRTIWVLVTSSIIDDAGAGAPGVLGMVSDITDRKQAEEALRGAEASAREAGERFRRVVETANEGLWIVGDDTRITFANRRVAEMFGYEPEELPGRSFLDFVPADRREEAHRHWRERGAGKTDRFEARHLKKDGSELWVLISTTPQHDAHGVFQGTITMFVDISDRKAAEAAAAASEARFRDFAEVASDWMWETDPQHRLTYISGASLPLDNKPFGRTRWELAGAGADDPLWRDHIAVLEGRQPFRDFEFTVKGGSGRTHYLVASGRPVFDKGGHFAGYRGTTSNQTRQREAEAAAAASEKQFRQFVETANEGVWMIDAEMRTTYANQRIVELLGYTADEVVGRSFLDFKFPQDHAESLRMWNERKDHGLERIETRLCRRNGRSLWVLLSATPRFDPEGKLAGSFMMLVDITARKEAEKAAARAKRELDAILASSSEGVAGLDNQWRYTYLNPAGERIAKVSAKDIVGRTGFDVYDIDMSNVFHQCYLEAKRDNQPVSLAAYSDVYEGWQEVRAYPHSEGLTVFFRDVTAERQAHLALAESERKLRAALENNESILASISDGFVALDNDWRFTFINPAAERMWNKRAEDLLGNSIFDALHVDPANPFHGNYLESKKSGEPIAFAAFSDMFGKWLEVRGYPHAGGYTLFFDDVTEERSAHRALIKSQKKLQAAREMNERIFETSLDFICITDRTANFLQINPGMANQLGYAANELVGRNGSELIHPDDLEATRAAIRQSRISGTSHTVENRCRRRDGQWVPVNWSIVWSERERSYFMIGRDMSERIEAQERLNRSQRLEAIGQLTGGIAHDFNNLLTVIMGNSDTLARGLADNERLRRRAELSLEAARRAAELTAQLLAFARRQTLAPKAVEANNLVRDLHELMQRSLGNEVEIEIVPGKSLWLCKVDSTQLETALLNLALNARDAMPGGGRLTIATSNRTVAAGGATGELAVGDYVAIEVADTGTGMPPEVMARAFEPFFTTKDIGKGSGLGLAMVYGFVKQSGGSAAIASEPGHGTKVTLYLPRAPEAAPAAVAPAVREGAPLPGGRETILVVEDDAAVRELVTDQLKTLGYRVLVAGNGRTARNILFGGDKVDLLFTDVMMPGGVTGTQLADEAEKQIPGLKILFTTGYAEVPALKNSRRGVALLRKPYKTRDLAHTVREMLDAVV